MHGPPAPAPLRIGSRGESRTRLAPPGSNDGPAPGSELERSTRAFEGTAGDLRGRGPAGLLGADGSVPPFSKVPVPDMMVS